jgi:hypothetical protein
VDAGFGEEQQVPFFNCSDCFVAESSTKMQSTFADSYDASDPASVIQDEAP